MLLPAVLAAIGWSNTLHEPRLMGWQKGMIMGTAPAPDQYRVLTPLLTNSIFRCTASQTVEEALRTLRHVYLAVHALAFAITGFCFVAFCRRWLTLPEALLGFALLMAICAVANLRGQIQVTDPLNLMFVTVGLWAIQQERIGLLFVVMVLGALNRESVLVLAGYYLLMEWPGPRRRVLTTRSCWRSRGASPTGHCTSSTATAHIRWTWSYCGTTSRASGTGRPRCCCSARRRWRRSSVRSTGGPDRCAGQA